MNEVFSINGPVIKIRDAVDFSMLEMVYVGHKRLIGEVILIDARETTVQVYESTTGLKPGEPVVGSGGPMSAELGPGILSNIFDGICRPLKKLEALSGSFISEGIDVSALNTEKKYAVKVTAAVGDMLRGGDIFAVCPETPVIEHRCMVGPNLSGEVVWAADDGEYTVDDEIVKIKSKSGEVITLAMRQKWAIKQARPFRERLPIDKPLVTGQRVIDTILPIAKGGTAAVPGGFGSGKTMTQHQLAKWCDADIIVYIGCGERGNEMTQALEEFTKLNDPRTGKALTDRTVLIANTSNMPVAAREASIYTGVTIAEYYRDMGYHIAIMADSTSRWAEALREISGRLEEMPAEEGFPAYLPSRISEFYERAGYVKTLNGSEGSVTIIGAVSPQGSDFSEPVTQNTKRFVRCFWALDKALAYARHYPAVNWNDSYSEYAENLEEYYADNVDKDFLECRQKITAILHEENKLMEVVKLIGADVLPEEQKLVLEMARVVQVGFLQQNAFHKDDTYVPLEKQFLMMRAILNLYRQCKPAVAAGVPVGQIAKTGLFEKVIRVKYDIPSGKPEMFRELNTDMERMVKELY